MGTIVLYVRNFEIFNKSIFQEFIVYYRTFIKLKFEEIDDKFFSCPYLFEYIERLKTVNLLYNQ